MSESAGQASCGMLQHDFLLGAGGRSKKKNIFHVQQLPLMMMMMMMMMLCGGGRGEEGWRKESHERKKL